MRWKVKLLNSQSCDYINTRRYRVSSHRQQWLFQGRFDHLKRHQLSNQWGLSSSSSNLDRNHQCHRSQFPQGRTQTSINCNSCSNSTSYYFSSKIWALQANCPWLHPLLQVFQVWSNNKRSRSRHSSTKSKRKASKLLKRGTQRSREGQVKEAVLMSILIAVTRTFCVPFWHYWKNLTRMVWSLS